VLIIPDIIELIDDEPRVSHVDIAKYTDNKIKSVQDLITRNISDFEEFGHLAILNRGEVNGGKGEQPKAYFLNEAQATLLMTYLRNGEVVKQFKKELVRQFFKMRKELQNSSLQKTEPTPEISTSELILETLENLRLIEILQKQKIFDLFLLEKMMKEKSPTKLLKIDFSQKFFLPTELGFLFGISGAEMNQLLEQKGFQTRQNEKWLLTEKGKKFGIELSGKFSQLKWKLEVFK
jgi:phage regulator Rha-like protein